MADKQKIADRGTIQQHRIVDPHDPNRVVYHGEQDCDPVLAHIAKRRAAPMSDDMRPVAEIPMVLYQQLQRDGILDDKAAFKRWLNDPDNKAFRIHPGRV